MQGGAGRRTGLSARRARRTKSRGYSRPRQTMEDQSILKSAVLRASLMPLLLSNLCCPDMFAKYHVASSQAHFILTKIFWGSLWHFIWQPVGCPFPIIFLFPDPFFSNVTKAKQIQRASHILRAAATPTPPLLKSPWHIWGLTVGCSNVMRNSNSCQFLWGLFQSMLRSLQCWLVRSSSSSLSSSIHSPSNCGLDGIGQWLLFCSEMHGR